MKAPCPACRTNPPPRSLTRRGAASLRWLIPGTLLAVMPKCPACLAAYIATASGIGLSIPAASFLRAALIAVCIASLAFLLVRFFYRRHCAR